MAERREREAAVAPLPAGAQERIDALKALFARAVPDIPLEGTANVQGEVILKVEREWLEPLCVVARQNDDLAFNFCRFIAGVDQMDAGIELTYALWSYSRRHSVFIKTTLPLTDPHVASVAGIWATANWHERETAEMFGVVFDGHPDLKHLLLDDDLNIHPLLKAHPLASIEIKQGVNSF